MESNKTVNIALWFVIGSGIFFAIIAFLLLASSEIEAFFGFTIVAAGFVGLGWAGRRLLLPKDNDSPRGVGTVAGVIFGGAGMIMMFGSIFLFWDGEFGGAIGLFIFGLIFCGVGFAGYRIFNIPEGKKAILINKRQQNIRGVSGYSGQRTSRQYVYVEKDVPDSEIREMQDEWAKKPWHQRADWAQGKVIETGAGTIKLLIGFTIFWNIISYGIASIALIAEWGSGNEPWFILFLPLLGLFLVITTVRKWIRRRKYGISVLELKTIPAYIGEHLKGTIKTGVPSRSQPSKGFNLRLVCVERHSYSDKDGDKQVSERELWREEQQVYGFVSGTGPTIDLSVYFAIPSDMPISQIIPKDDRTLWRLKASASTPGVDYAADFEVPVFEEESNTK